MGMLEQHRDELNLHIFLLHALRPQNANKNDSVCRQERQRLHVALGQIPQEEDPAHSWQMNYIELVSVALGVINES